MTRFNDMVSRPDISVVHVVLMVGVLASVTAPTAGAQSGVQSLHAISTGGGASVGSSPTAALYTNPAHLVVGSPESRYEIRLFETRSYAGGDLFQFERYNETLASGKSLTAAQVDRQLDAWFGDGQRAGAAYAAFVPISVTYTPRSAPWAVGGSVRLRGVTETGLNRGALDLLLRGTGDNRTVPVNGRYTAFSTVDVSGSFAYTFSSLPLSVGLTSRLILGTGFADGTLSSHVDVTDEALTHTFEYTARAAGAVSTSVYDTFNAFDASPLPQNASFRGQISGIGGGVDVGATYEVRSGLYLSMSVTDLGLIRWTKSPQTVTPSKNEFRFEGVALDLDRLQNEFDGQVLKYVKHQVDSLARAAYEPVDRERSAFSSALPTALHVNGTWSRGDYTVTGGATMGVNHEAGAVSPSPAVHVGGEVRLGPVPLRAGVRYGGPQAVTIAGGLGLHVSGYQFDVGASVTPSTSLLGKGARYAVGVSLATVQF